MECLDSFIPDFPIMEYENRIEFRINESISELYVRIEVLKPLFKREIVLQFHIVMNVLI